MHERNENTSRSIFPKSKRTPVSNYYKVRPGLPLFWEMILKLSCPVPLSNQQLKEKDWPFKTHRILWKFTVF